LNEKPACISILLRLLFLACLLTLAGACVAPGGSSPSTGGIAAFSVTYNRNGGGGTAPTDSTAYLQGDVVTVQDGTTGLSWSGFSFAGWNTKADGTGATRIAGDSFAMGTLDVTLYAVWVPDSLSFDRGASAICITGCRTAPVGHLVIPGGVTAIGDGAFNGAVGLTGITIPASVTSIGRHAFDHCSGLTSIVIPPAVTDIPDCAFSGCSALASITLPAGVTRIGGSAFSDCTSVASVTLPAGLTTIGASAFSNCSGLKSITLPARVTSIGIQAFAHCTTLSSVSLPDGVTSIGTYAFQYCSALTGITLPTGITTVDTGTFQYCPALTSIIIPASVTSLGNVAFQNCSALVSVIVVAAVPPVIIPGYTPFLPCPPGLQIRVPPASVGTYRSAAGWSDFASRIAGF
jgi:hypothetical protein